MKIRTKVQWKDRVNCKFDGEDKLKCIQHKRNSYKCENCIKSNSDVFDKAQLIDEYGRNIKVTSSTEWEGKPNNESDM